ncbi:MAG: hypothetical protein U1E15_12010 [Hyphomicrobiales bacterium]
MQITCTISVNVKAPALTAPALVQTDTNSIPGQAHGLHDYFSATNADQVSPYNTLENYSWASAALTRQATQVTVNKEFTPVSINGGGVSRVRISFSNTEPTAISLTGVQLTDDFPGTDIKLYTNVEPAFTDLNGNPNSNGCTGGQFTGNPGDGAITLSNANIGAGKTCFFEFNVTAYKGGNHINRINAGDLITNEGVTNASNVAATLTVGRQVNIGKGFHPAVIASGETSTLTIDFFNTQTVGNDETGASPALIDTLPAGVTVVGTPTTTCAGGVVTTGTSGGSDFIQLSGGTFVAESVCHITAQVTAATPGVYTNQIPVGALDTLSGAENPDPAVAKLRVISKPTISKSFSPSTIPSTGGQSTLQFFIANPNDATILPTGLTGVALGDVLQDMNVAAPPSVSSNCTGLVHDVTTGATDLHFSGISIAPSSSCYIQFPVTSTVAGTHPNQTTGATSDQNLTAGTPSNVANLNVVLPLTMTKSFDKPSVALGKPARMTITISNPNATAVAGTYTSLTDVFPTSPGAMTVAAVPNVVNTCNGSVVQQNTWNAVQAGTTAIDLRYPSIPANASCTISFNVVMSAEGDYTNTTSALVTDAGTTPAASANITVTPPEPSIGSSKTVSVVQSYPDGSMDAKFTIVVLNDGVGALNNLQVMDDLNDANQLGAAFTPSDANDQGGGILVAPVVTLTNTSGTAVAPTPRDTYDGTGNLLLGTDGLLNSGDKLTIEFTARVSPYTTGAPAHLFNQALVSGQSPSATTVSDLTENGTDPTVDTNDPVDGTPTPVSNPFVTQTLGVSKRVATFAMNADGTADVVYRIQVTNVGTLTLHDISLQDVLNAPDQLGTTFTPSTAADQTGGVLSAPVIMSTWGNGTDVFPSGNANYDGTGDLIIGSGTSLAQYSGFEVIFTVRVDPNAPGRPSFAKHGSGRGLWARWHSGK